MSTTTIDPKVQEFLADAHQRAAQGGFRSEFLESLWAQLGKKGELSEKQVAAVERQMAKAAEREAARELENELHPPAPVVTGKVTVTGEVLSVKLHRSGFGDVSYKMVVRDDRGFKVWGTVPSKFVDGIAWEDDPTKALKGKRVEFTATVEASDRDETFGFYKRPRDAKVIEEGA